MKRTKQIVLWTLTIVVTVMFLLAGVPKVMGSAGWIHRFQAWGYPTWFVALVGVVEVLGALTLFHKRLAMYGVGALVLLMMGALYTHLAAGEIYSVLRPIVFLAMLITIALLRRI